MRKGRGSCVEPSSLKNFGSMFDAEAIHAQIPSNIEPNYHLLLKHVNSVRISKGSTTMTRSRGLTTIGVKVALAHFV